MPVSSLLTVIIQMHPLSLLTHRARLSALDVKRLDTLPWKEDIKLGVVAIVDISGYTKLTDSLARVGNGERIREILNPPFELIIKAIHKHGGAIIKFAGDSVIAIWTPWRSSTQEFNGKAAEEELVEKCITCCSELMCMFKDYRLIIPERLTGYNTVSIRPGTAEGYDSGTGRSASRRNSAGWRNNSRTKDGKGLQRRPTEAGGKQKMREEESSEAEDEAKSEHQSLRIHIGVGVGSFRHVFLGSNVSVPGIVIDDKELDEEVDNMMRIEQFVSGPAVQEAGQMLMESATGELAFPSRVLDIMKTSLTLEPDLGELLSGSSKSSKRQLKEDNFFIIGAHFDTILRLLMKHSQPIMSLLATDAPPWISFEGTLPSLAISLEASRLALPFMDESLQKFVELALSSIQRIVSLQPETLKEEGMSEKDKGQPTRARGKSIRRRRKSDGVNKIDENGEAFAAIQLDDYNQLRRVSVVFLQVQGIPLEDIGDDGNLQKLQSLMCAVSSAVRKQGGCLRQFNCDEKGLCALLVWGLEGFSHEKGNAQPAILAAVEIKEQISRMFGSSFSIGVATGQVFAGVIGDEYRADGTILGPCVNLAARIMCQRVCKAKVLCDSVTYHDCLGELEFNSKYPAMFLKGVQDAVQVHEPILGNQIPQTDNKAEKAPSVRTASSKTNLKVNEDIMVAGRTKERNAVSDGIGAWYRGERTSVLITGKSGTGKTFLVKSILQTLKKDSSVIICHATGQENRQSAFFIFEYVIEAISTHLHASGWTAFRIRMCRQAMSKDLSSQTTFKEEFSSLPQTPSRRDSLTSGYGKSLLIKPGNNKRTSSAQRSSANVIFKMESAEMVARQRTASIAVEDPLSELLLALGEPLSTIELMKSLFPRLFGQFTRIVMPTAQDVGPRLLSYVSRILQTLFKMGLRTVFILDDVQWFDSGSYDVAIEMGIRCPFLLTVFISRPFEEYKESLKSRFLSISEPKHCIKIDLSKLDRDAVGEIIKFRFNHIMKESDKVSASLLNDVFQKSQGNPLAVRILCGILCRTKLFNLKMGCSLERLPPNLHPLRCH
ncbi:hypothetical protein BC829DRAFT_44887 [Chytridium lagenaria]|nr:hypothetical protein BC829DRAFT_44887 [Chytridium lagenaria]